MSTGKTLNDYIPLLRGPQQDYIVLCVQKFSDRGEQFHRGLLPFLPAEEAARCLEFMLEEMKGVQNAYNTPEMVDKGVVGEKFIRQIISVFRSALIYRLADNERSEVVHLNTIKLKRAYGKRFGKKFYILASDMYFNAGKRKIDGMFELQMVSRNMWKVTGDDRWLDMATDYLSDIAPPL